ncbi:MAG: flagellar biosynthesis protein FlgL, partial [Caldilineae bacterium]
ASIQSFLENVDDVTSDLHAAQSSIGARMQRVDRVLERLDQRVIDLKSLYSQFVDADMAETIAEMNAEQQAYEMSLATSARILPRSLLDFLR